ncbi:MAG TPA: PAS domain S-box protein [Anaerolineales bacterium]|nr:PAS domain S-box protein [Anaerolineales bacterium]
MKTQHKTIKQGNRGKSKSGNQSAHESKPSRAKHVRPLAPKQFVDILEHMNDGLVVLDKDWYYIYVNQKAARMLQRQKPSDLIGKHIWTEYPEGVGQPFHLAYEKAMREQTPIVFEEHYEPWDLWFENRIYPSPDRLLILFTEITDRKRIETLLHERQYLLQKILDSEPGTVYIYDLEERRNVYVNRYWLVAYGYTEEETQAMGNELPSRIFRPGDLERISAHHENWRQAGEGEIREIEFQVRTKSGEWRWLHSREAAFARDAVGRVTQILGITHDITESKQAEKALRESEEKFSKVFYASPVPMSISRLSDGQYVEVNESLLKRMGYRREEMIGTSALELGIWENAAQRTEMLRVLRKDGSLRNFEMRFVTRSGEVGTALLFREIIELVGEEHFIGTTLDITERKQTEDALAASEAELQALLASMNDVVLVIDRDGRYRKIAPTNPDLLYKPPEELLGKTLRDVFPAGQAETFVGTIRQVLDAQQTAHIEYQLVIGGREVWFDTAISPMDTNNTLWMARDITDRKRAEEGLRELNEELEQRIAARTEELAAAMIRAQESDRLKSAFLATMSHELRTPLNSIIGFTGVILQGLAGPLNEEQTKQLNMMRNSARHLLALINDVLDISKIEAGQLEILQRPFDMRQAVESALRVVHPLAQKKNLQLTTLIGAGVGIINNDRRRVEQVLINLVNNAVKFTEHGEIRIECQIKGDWLETCVRDHGIGIKAEDIEKLFKPFQQIDTGPARSHEGTGLGLAICKRLVVAMGGEIMVESQWGVGSTFKFTLSVKEQ